MALYRCEVKNISRGQGRSCVAAAAYRHRTTLADDRQQMTHSYPRKADVEHSEIIAPVGAPDWVQDRQTLWNRIDAAEKRKDARTAKEILVSLPRELDREQQISAIRAFVGEAFTSKGLIADVAIHAPDARDGEAQPHAHIMVSTRPLDAGAWAAGKDKSLDQPQGISEIRQIWADHCNRTLEQARIPVRVDHRSLADQHRAALEIANDNRRPEPERDDAFARAASLSRDPEPKIGPVALQMERQGRGDYSHALNAALQARRDRSLLSHLAYAWRKIRDQARQFSPHLDTALSRITSALTMARSEQNRQPGFPAPRQKPSREALIAAVNSPLMAEAQMILARRKAEKLQAAERAKQEELERQRLRALQRSKNRHGPER